MNYSWFEYLKESDGATIRFFLISFNNWKVSLRVEFDYFISIAEADEGILLRNALKNEYIDRLINKNFKGIFLVIIKNKIKID